jgi:hypothetical protein
MCCPFCTHFIHPSHWRKATHLHKHTRSFFRTDPAPKMIIIKWPTSELHIKNYFSQTRTGGFNSLISDQGTDDEALPPSPRELLRLCQFIAGRWALEIRRRFCGCSLFQCAFLINKPDSMGYIIHFVRSRAKVKRFYANWYFTMSACWSRGDDIPKRMQADFC